MHTVVCRKMNMSTQAYEISGLTNEAQSFLSGWSTWPNRFAWFAVLAAGNMRPRRIHGEEGNREKCLVGLVAFP